jgi:hypothetical protein
LFNAVVESDWTAPVVNVWQLQHTMIGQYAILQADYLGYFCRSEIAHVSGSGGQVCHVVAVLFASLP